MTDAPPPISYRVDDAAKASGISRSRLYEMIASGELPSGLMHGRRLILRDDLEAVIRKHLTPQAA
jgi:excisionase family DNA binding protein